MELSDADPKGLVRESYAIEGITEAECKSIFIDWALSLKPGVEAAAALPVLIGFYGAGRHDHPMTGILSQAMSAPATAKRRGGRTGRGFDAQPL